MPDRQRLRILQITRNLPPMKGGMERLNLHVAQQLAQEFAVAVIGPEGCQARLPRNVTVCEIGVKPLWLFFARTFLAALAVSRQFRAQVVFAGSGLTAPFAWLASKRASAKLVIYVHGLDLIENHFIYRWFWRPFIRCANLCIANSSNTARLAESIGVKKSQIIVIHPGVDAQSDELSATEFRSRFGLGQRPILLSVGRLIARKGLLQFVERVLPQIAEKHRDVCLLIIGDELPDLLHGNSSGLGHRIREQAKALGVAENLRFLGPQHDKTLGGAYQAADIHVFPVLEVHDDVEGFGMVAAESAAHGLPTVAFAVGGVPDAVADGVSGWLIESGDYGAMATRIVQMLEDPNTASLRKSAREFARQFGVGEFGARLCDALRQLTQVSDQARND